jgi:hypothetical protein
MYIEHCSTVTVAKEEEIRSATAIKEKEEEERCRPGR